MLKLKVLEIISIVFFSIRVMLVALHVNMSDIWVTIYKSFAHIFFGFLIGLWLLRYERFTVGLSIIMLFVVECVAAFITHYTQIVSLFS